MQAAEPPCVACVDVLSGVILGILVIREGWPCVMWIQVEQVGALFVCRPLASNEIVRGSRFTPIWD